jgi:hypothetical protein
MAKRKSSKHAAPVTAAEFDAALTELLGEATPAELLSIPGLYEVVSEHYNNEAIDRAKENRE